MLRLAATAVARCDRPSSLFPVTSDAPCSTGRGNGGLESITKSTIAA
jgi:hypothetical protein